MIDYVGERLRRVRIAKKLTVLGLAQLANVPQSTISEVENGSRSGFNLTAQTIKRLARALGVTSDYLIGMNEEDDDEIEMMSPWIKAMLVASPAHLDGWTSPFIDNTDGALEIVPPTCP